MQSPLPAEAVCAARWHCATRPCLAGRATFGANLSDDLARYPTWKPGWSFDERRSSSARANIERTAPVALLLRQNTVRSWFLLSRSKKHEKPLTGTECGQALLSFATAKFCQHKTFRGFGIVSHHALPLIVRIRVCNSFRPDLAIILNPCPNGADDICRATGRSEVPPLGGCVAHENVR